MAPYNFFFDILDDYQNDRFCDLEICGLGSDPSKERKPIRCHKLVMCSVIQHWCNLITEDTDRVHIPDIDHVQLKQFIDSIYYKITNTVHTWDGLNPMISMFLGMDNAILKGAIGFDQKGGGNNLNGNAMPLEHFHDAFNDSGANETGQVENEAVNIRVKVEVNPNYDIYGDAMDLFDSDHSAAEPTIDDAEDNDDPKSESITAVDTSPTFQKRKKRKCVDRKLEIPPRAKYSVKEVLSSKRLSLVEKTLRFNQKLMQKRHQFESIKTDEVQKLLQSGEDGILKVNVTTARVTAYNRPVVLKSLTVMPDGFFALIGLQQTETGLKGKSLAWTTKSVPEIEACFVHTIDAFHTVLGLSRASLTSASCFYTHSGLKKRPFASGLVCDLYRKFLYQSTRSDLEFELNRPETVHALLEPEPVRKDLNLPLKNYEIIMTSDLDDLDDIVLVGVYEHGVEVRQIKIPEGSPKFAATICSRLLTLVWVGGNEKRTFPESSEIYNAFKMNTRLSYTGKTIQKLLASNEELPRPLPFVTCDICGKSFQENIYMNNLIMHKRNHVIDDFSCDCDILIRSFTEKKRHYKECHHLTRTPKHPKMDKKAIAPKSNATPTVRDRPRVCDICGKVFPTHTTLKYHMERTHANLHCQECKENFGTILSFKRHWKSRHPDLKIKLPSHWITCDQCDAAFPRQIDLTKHWTLHHGPAEMQPFQCGFCQKGFCDKSKLRYHVIHNHIKNRPYECRSEGCKVAFNFNGNLYAHEKKVHGQAFGKTQSLASVLPDSKLLDIGCKLNPPVRIRKPFVR